MCDIEYDFENVLSSYIRVLKTKKFENIYTYRRIIIGYANKRNKCIEIYQAVNALENVISNSKNNDLISILKKEIKFLLDAYFPPVPVTKLMNLSDDEDEDKDVIKTKTKIKIK